MRTNLDNSKIPWLLGIKMMEFILIRISRRENPQTQY